MKRKLMLFAAALLSALWSQTGLATCSAAKSMDPVWDYDLHLSGRTAGEQIARQSSHLYTVSVDCDRSGGWFELKPAKAFSPAPLGNGIITTNIDFVGVSLTGDLLNEDTNGYTETLLTDGSFTSRRWVIPATEDSSSNRHFTVIKWKEFAIWASGPEDPKPGVFDTAPYFTLTADDGIAASAYRFGNSTRMIAACYPYNSNTPNNTPLTMLETYTNKFPKPGSYSVSFWRGNYSYLCDRDINVRFTFTPTNTVPGFPNLLAPEPGGPAGVGLMLAYSAGTTSSFPNEQQGNITLGEPYDFMGGPVNHVRRNVFYLHTYLYRYGKTEVTPGHFRTTATMSIQFQ